MTGALNVEGETTHADVILLHISMTHMPYQNGDSSYTHVAESLGSI